MESAVQTTAERNPSRYRGCKVEIRYAVCEKIRVYNVKTWWECNRCEVHYDWDVRRGRDLGGNTGDGLESWRLVSASCEQSVGEGKRHFQ